MVDKPRVSVRGMSEADIRIIGASVVHATVEGHGNVAAETRRRQLFVETEKEPEIGVRDSGAARKLEARIE